MTTATARLIIGNQARKLNGAALIAWAAALAPDEWKLLCEFIDKITLPRFARQPLAKWYATNEIHLFEAWTRRED